MIAVVLLSLATYDYDTGKLLYQLTNVELSEFSVSGDKIEDCRLIGVREARKLTAYYRHWYPNASTNVDCHWSKKDPR